MDKRDDRASSCRLGTCDERPNRRATEQRDELAPFQLTELHALPLAGAAAYRIGEDQVRGCCAAEFQPGECPSRISRHTPASF
jgi:hypothetical protein